MPLIRSVACSNAAALYGGPGAETIRSELRADAREHVAMGGDPAECPEIGERAVTAVVRSGRDERLRVATRRACTCVARVPARAKAAADSIGARSAADGSRAPAVTVRMWNVWARCPGPPRAVGTGVAVCWRDPDERTADANDELARGRTGHRLSGRPPRSESASTTFATAPRCPRTTAPARV
jgi:hypothetical protein